MSLARYRAAVAVTMAVMALGLMTSVLLGGCDTLIPTEGGGVPMKCHWAFRATVPVLGVGLVLAAFQLGLTTREGRRFAALAVILVACVAALLPTEWVIGICADGGMGAVGAVDAVGDAGAMGAAGAGAADGGMALCAVDGDGMDCHISAPVVWACAAAVVLINIVLCVKADPAAAGRPRLED